METVGTPGEDTGNQDREGTHLPVVSPGGPPAPKSSTGPKESISRLEIDVLAAIDAIERNISIVQTISGTLRTDMARNRIKITSELVLSLVDGVRDFLVTISPSHEGEDWADLSSPLIEARKWARWVFYQKDDVLFKAEMARVALKIIKDECLPVMKRVQERRDNEKLER